MIEKFIAQDCKQIKRMCKPFLPIRYICLECGNKIIKHEIINYTEPYYLKDYLTQTQFCNRTCYDELINRYKIINE